MTRRSRRTCRALKDAIVNKGIALYGLALDPTLGIQSGGFDPDHALRSSPEEPKQLDVPAFHSSISEACNHSTCVPRLATTTIGHTRPCLQRSKINQSLLQNPTQLTGKSHQCQRQFVLGNLRQLAFVILKMTLADADSRSL